MTYCRPGTEWGTVIKQDRGRPVKEPFLEGNGVLIRPSECYSQDIVKVKEVFSLHAGPE